MKLTSKDIQWADDMKWATVGMFSDTVHSQSVDAYLKVPSLQYVVERKEQEDKQQKIVDAVNQYKAIYPFALSGQMFTGNGRDKINGYEFNQCVKEMSEHNISQGDFMDYREGAKEQLQPKQKPVELVGEIERTVYGIGYLGSGRNIAFASGKPSKSYSTWSNMLKRCYCEASLIARPTYAGCYVCDEWHNFQNFAEWFDTNYVEGFHLDKDTLVDGNKIYSPATCVFISHADNNIKARAKSYKLEHKDYGVVDIYNLHAFCKKMRLNSSHMNSVSSGKRKSHKGWTKPETPEQKAAREREELAIALYQISDSINCWKAAYSYHKEIFYKLADAGVKLPEGNE